MDDILGQLHEYWTQQGCLNDRPADALQIQAFEDRYGVRLPPFIRDYFLYLNGTLAGKCGMEDEHLISFWHLDQVRTLTEECPGDSMRNASDLFLFADWSIWAHTWGVRLSADPSAPTPVFVSYDTDQQLSDSFEHFLQRYRAGEMGILFPASTATLHSLPEESGMRWRRLDVPGREESHIRRTPNGWRLTGMIDVEEEGGRASLRYIVECDESWRTREVLVEGEADGDPIRIALSSDGAGHWTRDGIPLPELAGALDVDLGFTPATNMLPIRRLGLAVGESASVRSAWLHFPEFRLELLEQAYTREAAWIYRYHALVDGMPFTARLDIDLFGRVLRYEGLWVVDLATADRDRGGRRD